MNIDYVIEKIEKDLNNNDFDIDKYKDIIRDNKDKIKPLLKNKEKKYNNFQLAYKILMNGLYGYFGTSNSRFFKPEIAEAITITGQEESIRIQDVLTKNGYKILYGDTDSVFILVDRIPKDIKDNVEKSKKWIIKEFVSSINKISDNELNNMAREIGIKNPEFGKTHFFKFKQEMIAKSGIFLPGIKTDKAKKRYDLYVIDIEGVEKNEFASAGTPLKQSKLPNIVKNYFEKFINKLLKEQVNDKNELISIIRELKNELVIASKNWDTSKFGSYNQFSKKLEDYPKTNTHAYYALEWNKNYAKKLNMPMYKIKVKYKFIEVKVKKFLNKNDIKNKFDNKHINIIQNLYNWCVANRITMIGLLEENNDKLINILKSVFDIDVDRIIDKYVYNIFSPYLMVLNIPVEHISFSIENIDDLL